METWTPEAVLQRIEGKETRDMLKAWKDRIASYDAEADLKTRIENYERWKKRQTEQGKEIPADSKPPDDLRPGPIADRNRPGYCYASVIRPLEGFHVKGGGLPPGLQQLFRGLRRRADVPADLW